MPSQFIALTGAAYQSRSLIAAAQRSLNLYVESVPQVQGEPNQAVHLCTPGLTLLSTAPKEVIRCLYTSSAGDLFSVAGNGFYYIDPAFVWHQLGTLIGSASSDAAPRYTPVSMSDSGISLLIVDGSVDGWTLNLPSRTGFSRIDSQNTVATGTVVAPVVVPGSTFYIDAQLITFSPTTTTAAEAATDIINASIPNITAYTITSGALVIKDTSGAAIIIGPGTANAALGFTDGLVGTLDGSGFYGADRVDFTDTYFVLNKPNTPIFYTSGSESLTFDNLDFAGKSDKGDSLVSIAVVHRVLWLLGSQTTEVWFNSGGGGTGALVVNTFPFEELPGTFFARGCVAKYSVSVADNQLFFLSQNTAGTGIVVMAEGYNCQRISTHAIETAFATYEVISDAVGYTYQQQGHTFYVLSFPTADKTWAYDTSTNLWHERCWIDSDGKEHRHRSNCAASAYGIIVAGDWETGDLFQLDTSNFTDAGNPIKRLRSFPHQIDMQANRRVSYQQFLANMAVGEGGAGQAEQTVVKTTFVAPDGTLLQNYVGTGDIGSTFTAIATGGEIIDDAFTGLGGANEYLASGTPLSPDYRIDFNAVPSSYSIVNTSSMYVIGRANASNLGYKVLISSNGSIYSISLSVMPASATTVALGTLTSGSYAVSLTMTGRSISVAVQRTQDSFWVNSAAEWQETRTTAIGINSSTYTAPGRVIIGGAW